MEGRKRSSEACCLEVKQESISGLRNQYHYMGGFDTVLDNQPSPYTKASNKCGCLNA
jgi:hypothetical protein